MTMLVICASLLGPCTKPSNYPIIVPSPLSVAPSLLPPRLQTVFSKAGIPVDQWLDYAAVAKCESDWEFDAVGDGGNARGLFQIHGYPWVAWAQEMGFSVTHENIDEPIRNARLAFLINEQYDLIRHGERWVQWSVKPYWEVCRQWI